MSKSSGKFFISTAIDYVNAAPHLGHAFEKIQADVVARYNRLSKKEVFFLSGSDENSLKNVQAAKTQNIPTKELVDKNSDKFYQLKKALNLSYDDFIRTTQERHIKGAQKLWLSCQKDIYKKKYQGLYCVGCEEFYKESELEDGLCPEHQKKPELIEEENYFFRLSKYQKQLKELVKKDEIQIIPQTRKNEVLSFINQGLEDICISRSAERAGGWGIEVPGDSSQIIWVWLDALSNYINVLGYSQDSKKYQDFWQENNNKVHVIGKGILRFHAVYWPAFLLSAGLALPKTIFVHGYITADGQKMSKSLGNVIDPFELIDKYGTDSVRYFLLREVSPVEDGDFSYQKLEERYNADLASGIGNLTARVVTLAKNDNQAKITNAKLKKIISETKKEYDKLLEEFKFNEVLEKVWQLISFCDKYIEEKKPWEKSEKQELVINDLLFSLENIAQMLEPFLPETSEKILQQIKTKKSQPLFPRID